MTHDHKPSRKPSGTGGTLVAGILIGLLLGLAAALAVAWALYRTPASPTQPAQDGTREQSKGQAEPANKTPSSEKSAAAKPRFDFYKILPGIEEPVAEPAGKPAAAPERPKEGYYLQVGAFQNADDADNLKARLALLGMEASINTATLPDKGVWHRVRLGPYPSAEASRPTKDTLRGNGIEATLLKVREGDKP